MSLGSAAAQMAICITPTGCSARCESKLMEDPSHVIKPGLVMVACSGGERRRSERVSQAGRGRGCNLYPVL